MRITLSILSFILCLTTNAQFGGRNLWFKPTASTPPPAGLVPFSFTPIPYSNPDSVNYGRGAEQWHNGSEAINNPTASALIQSKDLYYRFEWARIEGATQGSYGWITNPSNNYFDNLVREAINKGQQLSFGIMPYYSDGGFVSYGGGTSSYPLYLHTLMQAESVKDQLTPAGVWMPNWNSTNYLSRLRALHVALNAHILSTSYVATSGPRVGQTVQYRDVIYCIDIRGFGDFGEWHSGGMYPFGSFPAGTQPTAATLIEIIDCHTEVFQDWPLVMMVAAYNGTGGAPYIDVFHTYNEVGYYALTATNAWGKVGYRRDQVGATEDCCGYLTDLLEDNTTTYNGSATFGSLFLNLYKTAPGTGEPLPGAANSTQMFELEQQIFDYGATSFGNGNWGGFPNSTIQARIRDAWKRSGYRLEVTTGEAPQVITRNVQFQIKTNWTNIGITPAYNDWDVVFELQNQTTSAVVWTGTSSMELKLFRPDQGVVLNTDNLTVPGSVSAGTYKLVLRVKDPTGYRTDMILMMNGRNNETAASGKVTYTIFSSVTVN